MTFGVPCISKLSFHNLSPSTRADERGLKVSSRPSVDQSQVNIQSTTVTEGFGLVKVLRLVLASRLVKAFGLAYVPFWG